MVCTINRVHIFVSSLRGVLGGTLAGIPSQGSSRGESWLEEPSQGSPRTPVVETLSCGRKGSLRKGGNLLRQARPPGLRAFPGLNGTLVPAPRESNFRNTSLGKFDTFPREAEYKTQEYLRPHKRVSCVWVFRLSGAGLLA